MSDRYLSQAKIKQLYQENSHSVLDFLYACNDQMQDDFVDLYQLSNKQFIQLTDYWRKQYDSERFYLHILPGKNGYLIIDDKGTYGTSNIQPECNYQKMFTRHDIERMKKNQHLAIDWQRVRKLPIGNNN